MSKAIMGDTGGIEPYPDCKTPPYLTAMPEVVSLPLRSQGKRFLVLGSDGLYEWLSNQELVALAGMFLDGERAERLPRETVRSAAFLDDEWHAADAYHPRPYENPAMDFTFKDTENVATHIIRNAIAGSETTELVRQLGAPASRVRTFYRDDVSWPDLSAVSSHTNPLRSPSASWSSAKTDREKRFTRPRMGSLYPFSYVHLGHLSLQLA